MALTTSEADVLRALAQDHAEAWYDYDENNWFVMMEPFSGPVKFDPGRIDPYFMGELVERGLVDTLTVVGDVVAITPEGRKLVPQEGA